MSEHQQLLAKLDELILAVNSLADALSPSRDRAADATPAPSGDQTEGSAPKKRGRPRKNPPVEGQQTEPPLQQVGENVASPELTALVERVKQAENAETQAQVQPQVQVQAPAAAPIILETGVPLPDFLRETVAAATPAPAQECPIKNLDDLRKFMVQRCAVKGNTAFSEAMGKLGFTNFNQITTAEHFAAVWHALKD